MSKNGTKLNTLFNLLSAVVCILFFFAIYASCFLVKDFPSLNYEYPEKISNTSQLYSCCYDPFERSFFFNSPNSVYIFFGGYLLFFLGLFKLLRTFPFFKKFIQLQNDLRTNKITIQEIVVIKKIYNICVPFLKKFKFLSFSISDFICNPKISLWLDKFPWLKIHIFYSHRIRLPMYDFIFESLVFRVIGFLIKHFVTICVFIVFVKAPIFLLDMGLKYGIISKNDDIAITSAVTFLLDFVQSFILSCIKKVYELFGK